MTSNIYLVVHFNFPQPFQPEHGKKAWALHEAAVNCDWIEEVVAASGGVGMGPSCIWVFGLDNYAALDRLFHSDEAISKAYVDFFANMVDVQDMVREAVTFVSQAEA
ncbi:MAG: hypothetical protein R2873_12850 [Caldilineaceae bacterium]|nr:hypothetical protein [Caldilineaceae bacterium]